MNSSRLEQIEFAPGPYRPEKPVRRIARLLTLCALLSLVAPSLLAAPESLNLLERELSAAQTDASRLPGFLEKLVDSEVVLLTKRNVLAHDYRCIDI